MRRRGGDMGTEIFRRGLAGLAAALLGLGLVACEPGDPVDAGIDGAAPNRPADAAVISDSGRYVAFVSAASNLVPSDTNGVSDVFVRDRSTGALTRVSTTSSGGQLNRASGGSVQCSRDAEGTRVDCSYGRSMDHRSLAISDGGRYVAFLSAATNVPGAPALPQAYVKDRTTGALRLASRSATGAPANDFTFALELQGDGSTLAFWSAAGNLQGPRVEFSSLYLVATTGSTGPDRWQSGSDCLPGFLDECSLFAHDIAPSLADNGRLAYTASFFEGWSFGHPVGIRPLVRAGGDAVSYQRISFDFPGGHTVQMLDHGRYLEDDTTGTSSEVVPGNVEAAAKDVSGDGRLVVSVTDRVRVRTVDRVLQMRHRVNTGGGAYTGPTGTWQADRGFSGGSAFVTDADVFDDAGDPRIYRSERWGMSGYRLAVPNGRYRVRLHFAEISPCCPEAGDRVFDVRLESALVLDDFDVIRSGPYYEDGTPVGPFHAVRREFVTTVQDGFVDIGFSRVVQAPKISAIEVMDAR
jgi:hypothetical protein